MANTSNLSFPQGGYLGSSSYAAILNPNGQNLMIGNPNTFNVSNYGATLGPSNSNFAFQMELSDEVVRNSLIQKFERLQPAAEAYWNNLFAKNAYKYKGIIPVGAPTFPLLIWATENPVSFEWRIEQMVPARSEWLFEEVCVIPARHKFLDRGFLDTNSVIIQFQPMARRPVVLDADEPLISWFPGFVVETSYIKVND